MLSPDERARARRFRFERDRQRFIAGRGQLREVLGAMLKVEPMALVLEYGPFGKPRIAAPALCRALHFNVTHAEDLGVYAVANEEIGVDVERLREVPEAQSIAALFFSAREAARLGALPHEKQTEAFLKGWTRREALLKVAGLGLGQPLPQADGLFNPDELAHAVPVQQTEKAATQWTVRSLDPAPGYVGACATKRANLRLLWWNWP